MGLADSKVKQTSKFELQPGITLFDNAMSPCARRVRMTLLEKNIPYKSVEVDLLKGEQLSPEYKHICPNKKVPSIAFISVPSVEDTTLFESNIITEFLDSGAFPGPKLYPADALERAEVKMWQDWELGLVDDFVPLVYTNVMPFVLQLQHATKESYLASLPKETPPAKKELLSRTYDRTFRTEKELKQHAINCFQNLLFLEKALEGQQYLVGNNFSQADLSVIPRVEMFLLTGLGIPESVFPNVVAYLSRLGSRPSISNSQGLMTRLINKLVSYCPSLVVTLGNWRSGRQLRRFDFSPFADQMLSNTSVDRSEDPKWKAKVDALESNTVLVSDCVFCPQCWQVKLLLLEKGVKFATLELPQYAVIGRWAGSGGLIHIHHNGHDILGTRAVLDYIDSSFATDAPGFFPQDPLEKAKAQTWQAFDYAMGYVELAPLLECRLVSLMLVERFKGHLPELYKLEKDPQYKLKFPSILQCFVYGLMLEGDSAETLDELTKDNSELLSEGKEALCLQSKHEELLLDKLKYLDSELKKNGGAFIMGKELTVADITIFCRLCFVDGLGILQERTLEATTLWFKQLKETRPHFSAVSKQISALFQQQNI